MVLSAFIGRVMHKQTVTGLPGDRAASALSNVAGNPQVLSLTIARAN